MHRRIHPLSLSLTSATCGPVLVTSPDWEPDAVECKLLEIRIGPHVQSTLLLKEAACRGLRKFHNSSSASPTKENPAAGGAGAGLQRAVHLGGLSPGLRTERRNPYDTPQRKMVRARLPWIVNVEIRFGCCASTTVGEGLRCAHGKRDGAKSITECVYRAQFDTLTYGRADEASRSRAWKRGREPRCAARATGD